MEIKLSSLFFYGSCGLIVLGVLLIGVFLMVTKPKGGFKKVLLGVEGIFLLALICIFQLGGGVTASALPLDADKWGSFTFGGSNSGSSVIIEDGLLVQVTESWDSGLPKLYVDKYTKNEDGTISIKLGDGPNMDISFRYHAEGDFLEETSQSLVVSRSSDTTSDWKNGGTFKYVSSVIKTDYPIYNTDAKNTILTINCTFKDGKVTTERVVDNGKGGDPKFKEVYESPYSVDGDKLSFKIADGKDVTAKYFDTTGDCLLISGITSGASDNELDSLAPFYNVLLEKESGK